MTTTAQALKNRLSTIHRDLTIIVAATRHAAACVSNQRLTIRAASGLHHTAENDKVAERLDRMTVNTTEIGEFLRSKIRDVLLSYAYQRDRCSNSRRAFIVQGADVDQRIAAGMFEELEVLIKAASGEAVVEGPSQKVEQVPAKEFVYFTRMGVDTRIRRYSTGKDDTKQSELLADGVWVSSMFTIGMAKRLLAASPELEVEYQETAKQSEATYPAMTYIRVGNGKVYRVTDGETYTDLHLGGTDWEAVSVTAALLVNGVATGKFDEVCNPEELEKEEPINTATALLAGDMCRLIEKRGLGGGLPLVSMLESVRLLNPVARQVREDLFGMVEEKNGVSHEDVISLRRIIGRHCSPQPVQAKFIESWKEAHHKLCAIALGAKP